MNIRKILAITLSVVLLLSLCACGAAKMENSSGGDAYNRYDSESLVAPGSNYYYAYEDADKVITDEPAKENPEKQETALPENRKLIQKVWLRAETEDMDIMLSNVESRIAQLGGYVEGQEVYNGSAYSGRRYRTAELTIRIPAKNVDQFTEQVGQVSNIVSSNKTMDDVTLTYVATESRVTALEIEESRLLELLAKAENMADLLTIEARLTDVRTELEQVKTTLRVYDNQVDYGTVYLTISEVKEYTVVDEPETVWERIGAGLKESFEALGDFFVELFVFLVVSLPHLLLIGAVVVVIVVIIRRRKKKKAQQKKAEEN